MAKTYGDWLRAQRHARGWTVPDMRRHLRDAARAAGDTLPSNDCLSVMIRRWESDRSGISERYRLHFCRMLQITMDQFGYDPSQPGPPVMPVTSPSPAQVLPFGQAEHLDHAPPAHDLESASRVYLSPNVRLAIDAACYEAVRGILTDILRQLNPYPLNYISDPSAPGQGMSDVRAAASAFRRGWP